MFERAKAIEIKAVSGGGMDFFTKHLILEDINKDAFGPYGYKKKPNEKSTFFPYRPPRGRHPWNR